MNDAVVDMAEELLIELALEGEVNHPPYHYWTEPYVSAGKRLVERGIFTEADDCYALVNPGRWKKRVAEWTQ